jgi:hypothetical protein
MSNGPPSVKLAELRESFEVISAIMLVQPDLNLAYYTTEQKEEIERLLRDVRIAADIAKDGLYQLSLEWTKYVLAFTRR